MAYAIKGAVPEDCLDRALLFWRTVLERVDHGHGDFAFAQVASHRLAQHAFGSGEVERIIHDLECHPQIAAVLS